MNPGGWISIAMTLGLFAVSYLAQEQVKKYVAPRVLRWLSPLFPILKLDPWLFEQIAEDDLPPKQRRFFETHTPGFLARRFQPLGDFVLRRDPQPSCSRYFLSPDGTMIGGLTCYLGDQTIDCMSVLLDGMYLETANIRCSQLPPKAHGLQFFVLASDHVPDIIEHHAACMAKAAAEGGTQPATLTPDDLKAVSNYGRQLSLNSLYKQGALTELPAFLRSKDSFADPRCV
jgi:hypothetical protein